MKKIFIPLYTNGSILLVQNNKLGIVHCTYLGMPGYNFQKILYFRLNPGGLNIIFTFTNIVDPDEMPPYVAFHLGLRCLQEYLFRGFPNKRVKGKKIMVLLLFSCLAKF